MVHCQTGWQLGCCMESVLDVSLLSIFINDKEWNRECIYYLADNTKATGTLENKIKLIMLLTKWRNTKQ